MARIRSLKPEAFQSETLAEISVCAERSFYGLSTQVDDHGRIADKPVVINAALWAVRNERLMEHGEAPHSAKDLEAEIDEMEREGLVCRYVGCDGRRYLHLVTFHDHQKIDRPSKSRVPRCPRHQLAEECGKHARTACPSANTPRDSASNPEDSSDTGEPSANTPDDRMKQREHSTSAREDDARAIESPMQDLGSRTVDLGSGITKNSSSPASPSRDSDHVAADEGLDEDSGELPGMPEIVAANRMPEPGSDDDPDWLKFWQIWPKKVGKPDARKAWAKAVTKVAPFVIIAAAERHRDLFARERRDRRHIKDPSGWLNGERWNDEIDGASNGYAAYQNPANQSVYDEELRSDSHG